MRPLLALSILLALTFVPDVARAADVHLLDEATLSLELPGIPAESDGESPLQLGLARPSAGLLHAIVGCAAGYFFPGLGQIVLGYPGRGLLLMGAEVALVLVGMGLLFSGGAFSRGGIGNSPGVILGIGAIGLFALLHFGGMLDAFLLGMKTDRFGGG